ncbi:MAG TPA: NAD(P)/FAD-dependent oxidoreductase [Anaerolineae bacterium]|nr:NAD(P)/FAD-dependent oxidoreductase [Anaerolineae bacterium]
MKIGVIGGGLTGLTAAYELAKEGHEVVLFEREAYLGGQASTFEVAGARLERYYHHIFTGDKDIIALIEELGLTGRMLWLSSRVGFFYEGQIYDFVTPLDLLRFKPLGFFQRLRAGLITLYLQRFGDWRKLEDFTAEEWIDRYAGRQAYQVIFRPLLRAKFGEFSDRVTMAWLYSKFKDRVGSRSKGMAKELLGYMEGSFQPFIDALASRITSLGGQILTDRGVEQVMVEEGRVKGVVAGDEWPLDRVLATVPSFVFLDIAPGLPEQYAQQLREVSYQSALCLVLGIKDSLSRIYWLNISDPTFPFVGAIEHTNLIPPERYNGKHILYLSNYVSRSDPLYAASGEELLTHYLSSLKQINPDFGPEWVEELWLFREDAAQPIITRGYSRRIPSHRTPVEGLYLANTAQIYPQDRGMNYSVRLGKTAAQLAGE